MNKMNERTCTTRKAKHLVPKYLWYDSLLPPSQVSESRADTTTPTRGTHSPLRWPQAQAAGAAHRVYAATWGKGGARSCHPRLCLWLLPATVDAQAQRRRVASASLLQPRGSFPGQQGRPQAQVKRREPQSTRELETLAVFSMLLLGVASPPKR